MHDILAHARENGLGALEFGGFGANHECQGGGLGALSTERWRDTQINTK